MNDFLNVLHDCQRLANEMEQKGLNAEGRALREIVGAHGSATGSLRMLRYVLNNILNKLDERRLEVRARVQAEITKIDAVMKTIRK
jgi:hypothetical protein